MTVTRVGFKDDESIRSLEHKGGCRTLSLAKRVVKTKSFCDERSGEGPEGRFRVNS